MSPEEALIAKEHLERCESCRKELETMKQTLDLLDQSQPPPLSVDFKKKVIQEIRTANFPAEPLRSKVRRWLHVPALRWSIEGAAVTAMILLSVIIYRSYTVQTPGSPEGPQIRGGPEFRLEEVRNPVVVNVPHPEDALADLKTLIQSHHGTLVRRRKVDTGLEVTMNVPKEEEQPFLQELSRIGKVEVRGKEYKDTEGNIVVRLKGQIR
jgi:hypothetical protein